MLRIKLTFLFIFFLTLVSIGSGLFFYFPVFAYENEEDILEFRSGEFLIKFKNDPEIYKFQFSDQEDVLEIINSYQDNPTVEFIEPNYLFTITAFPNDPDYTLQWYLSEINARNMWSQDLLIRQQETITYQPTIAILDTGVDLDHPDLVDKIWVNNSEIAGDNIDNDNNGYIDDINGWDFIDSDADPNPSFSDGYNADAVKHGTIVAGVAAASVHNVKGIAGSSWFSKVMPLRVLDSNGSGDVFSVVQAIDYAIDNGADVINMSFVGSGFNNFFLATVRKAFDNDILVVAAAGNTDPQANGINLDFNKSYPVCYDDSENILIGVASVGSNLAKSSFSNYGDCIDIVAPGENIYAAQVYEEGVSGFTKYYDGYWSGTSLSAPMVSGVLATIKGLRPGFSADEIRDFILETAKDISSHNPAYLTKLGSGLIDGGKALELALGTKLPQSKGGQNNYIVAGLGFGSLPQIKILRTDGSEFKTFYAYDPLFSGPINVAVGDVNGDGLDEIITGAGLGGGPHIRIFNIEGQVLSQFFVYDKSFRGGIPVSVGDVDGDGVDEIITGIGKGGLPQVRIFDFKGNLFSEFMAYQENFTGGVNVATGDVNGDGVDDIVSGAGAGGGPHVRIFNFDGSLISQFFAYNKNFKGGVNVAVGDLLGDGGSEVIASIEKDSVPTVRVFSHRGEQLSSFFAYEPNFLDGVYVSADDIDNDGIDEIVTGMGVGGSSEVKVFDLNGKMLFDLVTHLQNYKGGVRPEVISY
ncbi:MAG: hypothetical protein CMI53_03235 [Parcubacteria group bacterium]|nr:hypothetical protein [Parcubacteria group bacterium]